MPNQQIFPSSTYPLVGDVQSVPGSPDVVVTGIQMYPFSSTPPLESQVPVFTAGEWVPSSTANVQANQSIECNGVVVSDDYDFYCNNADISTNQVSSAFPPNGAPVYCNGSPVA